MRPQRARVGARARSWGRVFAVLAIVAASGTVGVSDAVGQSVEEPTTTTAPPVPLTPDPPVAPDPPVPVDDPVTEFVPEIPTTPGAPVPPLINESPVAPGPPEPDPSPRIRVSLARLAVIDAQEVLAEQQAAATAARDVEAGARAAVDDAEAARTAAGRRLEAAREQLGSTAIYAYMHTPGRDLVAALRGDATAGEQERRLFAAAVDHHKRQVTSAERAVARSVAGVDAAEQALERARQAAADQDGRVELASTALVDARTELRTASAEEASPRSSWQLSLQGPTLFTADELTRWYEGEGRGSRASVPVAELVRLFVDHGTAEGIRGDMAFAQAIHETGWFANRDTITANNFAGIGHCSACAAGFPFATADIGVLAQIQLLESYAEANPTYDLPRAAPNLNGPRGCCQTWNELGGVWATDPNYGPRILSQYDRMLGWLVAQRSAAT
ncbi:MAG: glucosaminidase domain-containing protein [Acidimicrobiales bacterium]|nr:glucosaminidase domain-containing protein [Acidimicrobiales bacterium]